MSKWTNFRDDIINTIEEFFTHTVWDFLKPFIDAIEHQGATILITAAENAVQAGFDSDGDGKEKMEAALASFADEIEAKGLPFIESQARTMIELALQKAKTAAE